MLRRTTFCALIFLALSAFFAVKETKAQTVWGISGYDYDQNQHKLYGYHATELDYYAWLYYDAYVEGTIYDQYGNELDFDWDYDDTGLAEAYTQSSYSPGQTYYVISDHWIVAYYYEPGPGGGYEYWNPYGYGFSEGGGYGGFFGFSQGYPGYTYSQYIYLGWTGWELYFFGEPHIDQMVPTSAPLGVSVEVNFSGTDFGTNPTINVSGSGVSVGSISYSTDTRLTAIFNIAENASTGNHSVSITTSEGVTSNSVNLNVGDRTPQITSINPSNGDAGQVIPVTISGTGFGSTPIVNADGITVQITSRNDTQINANFSIPSTAIPGDHQVFVTSNGYGGTGFISGGGSSPTSNTVNFTVNAHAPPHITDYAPQSAQLGVSVEINVVGENFGQTRTLQISGQGVTVQSYTPVADPDHQIVAMLNIAENAETGNHGITVSAGGMTSNSVNFLVGDRTPTITSLTPPSGIKGTTTEVVVTGRGFGTSPTLAISGTGVNITINSATDTRITASFAISALAEQTNRQVTLTSRGISGNGFMQSPDATPTAQATFLIDAAKVKINSVDKQFAPSVERLNITYTVTPANYNAPAARVEIFKKGDSVNPIYRDNTTPGGSNVQYMQGGSPGWDGMANMGADAGKYIGPENSPYTVRVTIASSDFTTTRMDQKEFKVLLDSVETTPISTTEFNIIKPWMQTTAPTELDTPVTVKVKIKNKANTGVVTAIPFKVKWSFEDPDDTAGGGVIDLDNRGDDNAPIAENGKRGAGSIMWKAIAGFTAAVDAGGQIATSDSVTTLNSNDLGTTKINFSSSVIGGDNYILKVQVTNSASQVIKDVKFEKWSVRKALNFTEAYQMTDGADLKEYVTVDKVKDAYKGDGYTDYCFTANSILLPTNPGYCSSGTANPAPSSPEYLAGALSPPVAAETPTAQEITDYASTVPATQAAAKAAITTKAQAWFDRNKGLMLTAESNYINSLHPTGSTIIGARQYHVKYDGVIGDGRPAGSSNYYPDGIVVKERNAAHALAGADIDPNKDWNQNAAALPTDTPPRVQGEELDGTRATPSGVVNLKFAFIFLNTTSPNRKKIVGRHEVGHASDHVKFGVTGEADPKQMDHWTNGLMHKSADDVANPPDGIDKFADDSILRLRGRKRI